MSCAPQGLPIPRYRSDIDGVEEGAIRYAVAVLSDIGRADRGMRGGPQPATKSQ